MPQRYRDASWSQYILSTPERIEVVRQIHHIAALVLTALVIYHLGRAILMLARRKLPGDMLLTWQDMRDAWKMVKHLLFLSKEKPQYGKYNFEQKFTYWFIFFGIGIMVVTGFILWFPEIWTRIFPGGIIPAATGRRRGRREGGNRSEVVRQAVQEFLSRRQRREREDQDRRILGAHRDEIERQAGALLAEQAEP